MHSPSPLAVPLLTPSLDGLIAPRTAQRDVAAGRLVRVRRGVYAPKAEWSAATPAERYRALIHATAACGSADAVISHESAAAVWGLPEPRVPPQAVHVIVAPASGGRSDPGIRRHGLRLDPADIVELDGLRVTSIERTLLDLAATARLYDAVIALDSALLVHRHRPAPLTTREALRAQGESMLPFRGHSRAKRLIDFAESGAESPAESASRVSIALAGFPPPELQRGFVIAARRVSVDFYWESVRGVGECDGDIKYTDPALRGARSLAEVLRAEKRREDELRRQVRGFQRWSGADAFAPARLRPKLLELGLRTGTPRLRGR